MSKLKEEIDKDKYIKELELALIFMCDVYNTAKDSIASCREGETSMSDKYMDLWFNFPMVQGTMNNIAINKIGNLRTKLGNRESNSMSLTEILEMMKKNRMTEDEIAEKIRKNISKK